MSQTHYFVSRGGKQEGPYSIDYIREKLGTNEFKATDHLYDASRNEWVLMLEFYETSEHCIKPETSPRLEDHPNDNSENGEGWFILKGEHKYGPFSLLDLLKMLQEKALFEYDYVWKEGFLSWCRIAEVAEFKKTQIQDLVEKKEEWTSEAFFRRRHARADYGASLIIHNNIRVWRGESLELSAGGAGVVMENVELMPGEIIHLHFKPGEGVPPFNAECEIVSKAYVSDQSQSKIRYGVRFTKINYIVQKAITEYAAQKVA